MRKVNWQSQAVKDAKNDILREKSLWDAYRQSRLIPSNSWFNAVTTIICVVLLAVFLYFDCTEPDALAKRLAKFALDGITFASTILGFLVAGFTVFATITKPELFVFMAIRKHSKTNLSWLKYNFFRFIDVFIAYLIFGGYCLLVRVLYEEDSGNVVFWLASFSAEPSAVKADITKILYLLLMGLFVQVLLLLKSFIFNVYHVVMTAIRWELENKCATASAAFRLKVRRGRKDRS